jgi:hypothetical protein
MLPLRGEERAKPPFGVKKGQHHPLKVRILNVPIHSSAERAGSLALDLLHRPDEPAGVGQPRTITADWDKSFDGTEKGGR